MIRIGWFAPPGRSDVPQSQFSYSILPILSNHADVTVWIAEESGKSASSGRYSTRTYSRKRVPWEEFNNHDVCVFNVVADGPDPGFIGELSHNFPGITVLHGCGISHLLMQYGLEPATRGFDSILELANAGPAVSRVASQVVQSGRFPTLHGRHALDTWLSCSLGIMVQDNVLAQALEARKRWPVVCAPDPFRNPQSWVEELIGLGGRVTHHREKSVAMSLLRKVSGELAPWLANASDGEDFPGMARLAEAIEFLTLPKDRSSL